MRNHYVPKMVLKRFVNEQGKLYCFDKRAPHSGVFEASPNKVFVERDAYTRYSAGGIKDFSVERFFSQVESRIDPIIGKILSAVRQGRTPGLGPNEREAWDEFFYYQWKRVPDMVTSIGLTKGFS